MKYLKILITIVVIALIITFIMEISPRSKVIVQGQVIDTTDFEGMKEDTSLDNHSEIKP